MPTMSCTIGYNTNGFAHHRLSDALEIIAELGYGAVALTPDVHHLDIQADDWQKEAQSTAAQMVDLGLSCIIESGARFNLNTRRKHFPSLLCGGAATLRLDNLKRCVDLASILGAPLVSLWSGHNFEGCDHDRAWERLIDGINELLKYADGSGVDLGIEPEPGMFLESLADYETLKSRLDATRIINTTKSRKSERAQLGLALDLGHCLVTEDRDPARALLDYRYELASLAIEDMKRGVHKHLEFGAGDMDFAAIAQALADCEYAGVLAVELGSSSSNAVAVAEAAMKVLRGLGLGMPS